MWVEYPSAWSTSFLNIWHIGSCLQRGQPHKPSWPFVGQGGQSPVIVGHFSTLAQFSVSIVQRIAYGAGGQGTFGT